MLPAELSLQLQDTRAELLLRVDADLFWFQGHFPGLPVLPGVAQLDWAIHYGSRLLAPGKVFTSVDNIKFQQPILPGSTLRLTLNWQEEKGLIFQYHRVQEHSLQPASSGKVRLC